MIRVGVLLLAAFACGCGNGRGDGAAAPGDPQPAAAAMVTGLVAHRGASAEAPENTLAAFRLGWELGAESCETDVRITADGAVVIIHDDTTARTGGVNRRVAEQTLAELQRLDVGSWKAERYRGERIPTLKEALEAVPPGRMLFVELKDGVESAAPVAEAIRGARPGSVALQAYDPEVLAAAAKLLPGVPAYWTLDPPAGPDGRRVPYPLQLVADAKARGFAGLALDYRGMTDGFLAECKRQGVLVNIWTINDAPQLREWLARVRYVETDQPGG